MSELTLVSNSVSSIRECPVCKSAELEVVLELPSTPLGDRYEHTLEAARGLDYYPLDVGRCLECGHSFIPLLTDVDQSYQHYLFESGKSPGLEGLFKNIVDDIIIRHALDEKCAILDIGCNDGTWLNLFRCTGARLLGVEPAPIPSQLAISKGLEIRCDYFSPKVYESFGRNISAPNLISMNFMFANLPNPSELLSQVLEIADDQTVISIITGYHPHQLSIGMFDYVYHEHLSYFTLSDFNYFASKHELTVTECRYVPLKGGSIHVELMKNVANKARCAKFDSMLKIESWYDQPRNYLWDRTKRNIECISDKIRESINNAQGVGKLIIGYGASHSTTTLTHALGLQNQFDLIVDDNLSKINTFSPGTGIPVRSPGNLKEFEEPLLVILAWQHGDKIIQRLQDVGFKGTVIIPFPSFSEILFD